MKQVHATSIAIDGYGVLLRGASGSGKSDLALRMVDEGACLVSDDYTNLEIEDGRVIASAPENIAGLLEVRGVGILNLGNISGVPLTLVADLTPGREPERLPFFALCEDYGVPISRVVLDPFHISATAKLRQAVRVAANPKVRADG